jgi:hypothetical protein
MTNNEKKQTNVKFLAIDQFVESNIVAPTEVFIKDRGFVGWGEVNNYPEYIEDLYQNVSTLHSIIDGTTDYVCGDSVKCNVINFEDKINRKGETIQDLINWIAKDLVKFNGFALNIVRNKLGTPAEIYYLDFKRVRSNKEGTKYYYSTDWGKSYGRVKYIEYDSFLTEEGDKKGSTIFYYKNDINRVYPTSIFSAAVIACETERKISEFHLNNISNSFSSNYIINFNNGRPSDEIQEEIEMEVYDKFCGVENSGRPMLSFNNNKDSETTVTKIDADSFADKYNALTARTKQEIFTSFRCSPILFGIDQEKTGFNANEYASAFRLFNKTVVEPFQNKIKSAFDKIFNTENSIEIKPFTINFDKTVDA